MAGEACNLHTHTHLKARQSANMPAILLLSQCIFHRIVQRICKLIGGADTTWPRPQYVIGWLLDHVILVNKSPFLKDKRDTIDASPSGGTWRLNGPEWKQTEMESLKVSSDQSEERMWADYCY